MSISRLSNTTSITVNKIEAEKINVLTQMLKELLEAQHCILATNSIQLTSLTVDQALAEIRNVLNGEAPTYSGDYPNQIQAYGIQTDDVNLLPISTLAELNIFVKKRDEEDDVQTQAHDRRELIEILIKKFNQECLEAEKIYNSYSPAWPPIIQIIDNLESISEDMREEMLSFGQDITDAKHVALENLSDKGLTLPQELVAKIFSPQYIERMQQEQHALAHPNIQHPVLLPYNTTTHQHDGILTYQANSSNKLEYALLAFFLFGIGTLSCIAARQLGAGSYVYHKLQNIFKFFRGDVEPEGALLTAEQELLLQDNKKFTPTNDVFIEMEKRQTPNKP